MSIGLRIKELRTDLKISQTEFAERIGVKQSPLSQMEGEKILPSIETLSKIIREFNISYEWLIDGIGEKPNIQNKWHIKSATKSTTFSDKTKSAENVALLKNDDSEVKPNIQKSEHFKSVNKSVNFSDKTKSAKNVTHLIEDPLGVPLIPVDAMAGFGTGDFQVMEYETSRYLVPEFTELAVDFMIRVKGSSMQPKYNSGDLVACKKLETACVFFQWNNVYVLATVQGALIKRIKKGKDDDHVLIISDNPAYDPFELNKSEIKAIAIVCGVIRLE